MMYENIDYVACIYKKYPTITDNDFTPTDRGNGFEISSWNESSYGIKPTKEDLELVWIDVVKDMHKEQVKTWFLEAFDDGFTCPTSGITMDCKREDLYNLSNLKEYLIVTNQPKTMVRDLNNNFHEITIEQLGSLIINLIAYGLWLYQHKWELEVIIMSKTSINEIEQIIW